MRFWRIVALVYEMAAIAVLLIGVYLWVGLPPALVAAGLLIWIMAIGIRQWPG